ncbi:MAG: trigger factor [Clostridia bacterium]|nr:trigger factor [Clostridia bacterium]
MAVKTEQVEKNLVKLTFEVSAEEFGKAVNKVYLKNKNKINIPGFRKGKAPKNVVEKYYGKSVFYEDAVNAVLPDAYSNAVKESELDIVARPDIDIDGEIEEGNPVVFVALVTTKPEVKLGEYKGIKIEKIEHNVTEEDIDNKIAEEQKKNARIIFVEDRPVQKGDIVVIDFDGSVEDVAFEGGKAEDYELEIGSDTFIPGFEDQLIGAEADSEVKVEVKFPEEYHAPDLAGKDAVFMVKVKSIKSRELPEINDDFASEVSEFDTLAEYKKSIKEELEKQAENQVKEETENAVVKAVVENAEFELPDAMIDAEIDRRVDGFAQRIQYQGLDFDTYLSYTGTTKEAFRENFREQAKESCGTSIVIEAVMKAEGIETGAEEFELNLIDMAKKYNMELDKLKELLSDEEKENIKKDMAMGKTVEMLVNNAVIK